MHVSFEVFDLLALDALSPTQAQQTRLHLEDCPLCQARWVDFQADLEHFRRNVIPRTLPGLAERVAKPLK